MKIIFLIQSLFFISLSTFAADINPISNAFKTGNATLLIPHFDTEVDMTVSGSSTKCNATKAAEVLNVFFSTNKPTSFTVAHNADKKDSGFIVGKMTSGKNEYRVNISYRIDGNKAIIQSIRVE
ncbi:MAG: DUF4783 domain-containing protein [Tannerellaceae bacterium]|jgi:hypothetical protein|nr:DUF4783 domain-containing protein [Tannerellaceae bacterium]